jgi:hypothetical protein
MAYIRQNFVMKINDIRNLKCLIGIMLKEKNELVKNLFNEINFKLAGN